MHLIQNAFDSKFVFLTSDINLKHFSSFVFDFNLSNKTNNIPSIPTPAIKFSRTFQRPPVYSNHPSIRHSSGKENVV